MWGGRRFATWAPLAETFANGAHPRAPEYIEALRAWEPVEAEALLAIWHQRTGNAAAAMANAERDRVWKYR